MSNISDKIDSAIKMVKEENETAIYADEYVFVKKFFNRKRIIILTERHLFYFSKKEGNLKRYNVHNLNGITIDDKQIILDLKYHKELKILVTKETEESQGKFIKALISVVQHISSDKEIEKIKFNSAEKTVSLPSFYGSFCRFELSIEGFYFQPNELDEVKIRFFLLFHRKFADFSSFVDEEKGSKFFFEFLPLCPSTKLIKIKQFSSNDNIYHFLNNYINNISNIENISIDGGVNNANDNAAFSNFLKSNLNSNLVGLSFSNSKMTNEHLSVLQDFIVTKKIQAIEFHNSFENEAVMELFVSSFLPSISPCQDFRSLFLENVENVDFDELYKNLPQQVKALSIVNSDASVNQIFKTIKTNSKNITVLNLSFNPISTYQNFSRKDFEFYIPDFLTVLQLDFVTFPFGSLIPFLRLLFTEIRNDSEISIAHIIASDSDLCKLDGMFKDLVDDIQSKKIELKNIKSLKWDLNPISPHFITYLSMQSKLSSLSISGCYSPNDKLGFDDFCEFISKSTSIEKLICRRFDQLSLESLTPQLISAVLSSNISFLDISSSCGGSICYQSLKELISKNENQFIKCLIYDGLEPSNKDDLIDFLQFVKQKGCSTKCSFPIHDIEYLYKQRKIIFSDVSEMISLCQLETKNDYIRPFMVFFKENQFGFPFYFRDECEKVRIDQSNDDVIDDERHPFDETNPEFFFGSFFDEINRKSYSKNDRFIFSFFSEDENSLKNKSMFNTIKYSNTRSPDINKNWITNDSLYSKSQVKTETPYNQTNANEKTSPKSDLTVFNHNDSNDSDDIIISPTSKTNNNERNLSKSSIKTETPKAKTNVNEKQSPKPKPILTVSDDSYSSGDDDIISPTNKNSEEKNLSKSPLKTETPKAKPNVNENSSPKPKPKLTVSDNSYSNDDDYSSEYLSQNDKKSSAEKPKIITKPRSQISPPVKPNFVANRSRMNVSPKVTTVQTKKITSPPLVPNFDSNSYSYDYSQSE